MTYKINGILGGGSRGGVIDPPSPLGILLPGKKILYTTCIFQ